MKQELKFKTSLNCEKCVAKIKPLLDKLDGVESWTVDTSNSDKILTVQSSGVSAQQVVDTIESFGFDVTPLQ